MFKTLAEPDGSPLPGPAPVEIVMLQLDFEEERPLRPRDGIAWQRLLTNRDLNLPRLNPVRQAALNMDVVSHQATVASQRNGWQTFFDDGLSNACLFSSGFNIERYHYPGFDRFLDECSHLYEATEELLAPKVQTRISLRYSNALSDERATDAGFWNDKVRAHYLGPLRDACLAADYERGVSLFHFSSGTQQADLRIGTQPDRVHEGSQAVVFVTEAFEQSIKEMHRNEFLDAMKSLHSIALKLFYSVLTPEYAEELRAEV